MTDAERIAAGLVALADLTSRTAARADELTPIVAAMRRCLASDGTLFFAGNGGSAADAQHIAAEYVVRYHADQRHALRAIALTTDSSILSAAGNDFGFDQVFARQVAALGRPGDLLCLHSTSGNSGNCLAAATAARALGMVSVAFLGRDGGALRAVVDHAIVIDDTRVNHIQELHLALQHQIAAILTAEFGG
ncbi:MAG: SIS domain-containing protein [Gemmatimonadota bacterium]